MPKKFPGLSRNGPLHHSIQTPEQYTTLPTTVQKRFHFYTNKVFDLFHNSKQAYLEHMSHLFP